MKNLCIFPVAKMVFLVAVFAATTLLFSEAKADFLFSGERLVMSGPGTLTWMPDESMDNILQPYPFISRYFDGTLLAAANVTAKTANKKTPEKSASKKTGNNISLSVKAAYLMPMGDWKKLIDPGYGGMLEVCYNDLFWKNFTPGIEVGFLYAPGKNDNVKSEYIVPVFATFGYKIHIVKDFEIVPKMAAGGGYFNISYTPYEASAKTKSQFEFMAKGGTSIIYDLTGSINLEAESEYGMIFEKDGQLPFVLFQLGCVINF
jgi:hypothetical protein